MAINLYEVANKVTDEQSFLEFMEMLSNDWEESRQAEPRSEVSPDAITTQEWQNYTIGDFLEAGCRWGNESINGLVHYPKPTNPWQRMAHLLYAGKCYE